MVDTEIVERLNLTGNPREEVRPSAADAHFLSEADIRDVAVELALQGIEPDEALTHIDNAYAVREVCVEAQYQPELELTVTILKRMQDNISEEEATLKESASKAQQFRHEKSSLTEQVQKARLDVYINIQEIKKRRLEKEKELFESEDARLKSEANANYDQVIEDLNKQIQIAERLYELDKKRWEINKPEYDRRVGELTAEKERVEEELNAARNNINAMKRFGITRHTAGFLIWGGYASLAGVGGVIANLLSDTPLTGGDYLSLIFEYLANIIRALQTTRTLNDFWYTVLWPSIVVVIILAFTGGLLWLVDRLLRKFDRANWGKELRSGTRSRQKGKESRDNQPPFLTPEINRMSIPLPDVDRKSYAKLLALLPYVFLAFVVVLLSLSGANLGGQATGTGASSLSSPSSATAFSLTYIGIVFALLTVSVSVLYATKVIEPRWWKLVKMMEREHSPTLQDAAVPGAKKQDSQPGIRMYLRAHWEFVIIICSMVVALLVVIFLPTKDYRSHVIWSAVAVFMCFSSLAFAYGLIQRGLFRNEDYLSRRRDLYRVLIEKYSTAPTIVDVFETVNPNEVTDIINNYRRSRQNLDELRLLYELKRHFADNYVDDQDMLKYWSSLNKWANPFSFLKNLSFKKLDPDGPELLDYEAAPEETKAVNQLREEQLHLTQQLDELATEAALVERSHSEARSRLRDLKSEIRAQEKRMVELRQSYEQAKARLKVRKEADSLTFKAAYGVASKITGFANF